LETLNKRRVQRIEREAQNEMVNNETALSAVIERWIHNQGNYSLFAVFVAKTVLRYAVADVVEKRIKRLVSGIPDKIKFVMWSWMPVSVPETSESLMVIPGGGYVPQLQRLLLILNECWQTLDLISMMEELKRSVNVGFRILRYPGGNPTVSITDRLSSRPRFKREEDLTDRA